MTPIHLLFTPDRNDVMALIRARPTPQWHWWVFLVSLFFVGMLTGFLGDTVPALGALMVWNPPDGERLATAAGAGVWAAIVFGVRYLERRLRAEHGARHAGPVEIAIDDSAVTVTEAGRTGHWPWAQVLSIGRGRDHVFMALAAGRRLALPRRAFADDAAMTAFATEAEARVALESALEDERPHPAAAKVAR
jgi:hypothetical protein